MGRVSTDPVLFFKSFTILTHLRVLLFALEQVRRAAGSPRTLSRVQEGSTRSPQPH